MTRSLLRATTALTLSLSLLQPGYLPAQSLGEALEDLEALEAICAENPDAEGCDQLQMLQEEAEAEAEAEVEAEPGAEAEVDVEAEAEMEAQSAPEEDVTEESTDAPAEEIVDEAVDEAVDAPAEDAAEEPTETEAPAEAVAEEPATDVPAEEAIADDPVEAVDDAPVEALADEDAEAPAEEVTEETVETPQDETVAEQPVVEETLEDAAEIEAEAEVAVEAEPVAPVTEEDREASAMLLSDPEVAEAAETLSQALSALETDDATTATTDDDDASPLAGAAAALAALLAGEGAETAAGAEPAEVLESALTEETTRSSGEEFDTRMSSEVQTTRSRDRGMSDLERAGLVALGALAVGVILSNGNRVVASSGDRVVVDRGDGNLALWKDDDALLRQPGANQRVERFADGSTITRLDRADGTQIITIRDATGRVLRRARVELDGSQTLLIDDTRRFEPVEVSRLPPPRMTEVRITEGSDPALVRALLQAAEQPEIGRSFSLRQVRETQQLRELAPELSGNPILFATGSSAVRAEEAPKLLQLGRLMQELIAENPRELFLIEGHTDATGPASFNLALSDRRAESVALALTEYFGVPPENMIVQGYGEEYLKIPTLEAEPANRRVAVRRISWLVAQR